MKLYTYLIEIVPYISNVLMLCSYRLHLFNFFYVFNFYSTILNTLVLFATFFFQYY